MGEQAVQVAQPYTGRAIVEVLSEQAIHAALTHVCLSAPHGVWLGHIQQSAVIACAADPDDVSRGLLVRPIGSAALSGPPIVEFRFSECTLRIAAASRTVVDGGVILRPPWEVQSRADRSQPRIVIPDGAGLIAWIGSDRREWTAPIVDFSVDGVKARLRQHQRLPHSERFALTIRLDDCSVLASAELRRIEVGSGGLEVGLAIDCDAEQRRLLANAYCHYRFPRLRRRSDVERLAIDELFERSGYYALCRGMQPVDGWYNLRDSGRLSHDVVYCDPDGKPIGHISFTRSYPRSWTLHQVASIKDSDFADDARRNMYLYAGIPVALDGRDIFLYCYYNRSKRWHKLLWEGFAEWLGQPEHALVFELDRYEPPTRSLAPPGDVAVTPLVAADEEAALALIRDGLPPIAMEAFEMRSGQLVTRELSPGMRDIGIRRERQGLVVCENGRVVGVALYEVTSRELSVFNLFNMAMLFFAEAASPEARAALGHAVVERYATEDAGIPMIVTPRGAWPTAAAAGFTWVEAMGTMMWSGEALVHYQSYVATCFSKITAARTEKTLPVWTAL